MVNRDSSWRLTHAFLMSIGNQLFPRLTKGSWSLITITQLMPHESWNPNPSQRNNASGSGGDFWYPAYCFQHSGFRRASHPKGFLEHHSITDWVLLFGGNERCNIFPPGSSGQCSWNICHHCLVFVYCRRHLRFQRLFYPQTLCAFPLGIRGIFDTSAYLHHGSIANELAQRPNCFLVKLRVGCGNDI